MSALVSGFQLHNIAHSIRCAVEIPNKQMEFLVKTTVGYLPLNYHAV